MSYLAYKWLHLMGVFAVLMGLGGQIALSGVEKKGRLDKLAGLCHGLGLLVVLVAGFGLIVRLAIPWPWPGWVLAKLVIWLLVGSLLALVRKRAALAMAWWWVAFALAASAAYLALFQPF